MSRQEPAYQEKVGPVTFSLYLEDEDVNPEGCFRSDDPASDRKMCQDILRKLDSGDQWAWFCARVEAEMEGFTGNDYLGGCSYRDSKEFTADGYWSDLKEAALRDLKESILSATKRGETAKLLLLRLPL